MFLKEVVSSISRGYRGLKTILDRSPGARISGVDTDRVCIKIRILLHQHINAPFGISGGVGMAAASISFIPDPSNCWKSISRYAKKGHQNGMSGMDRERNSPRPKFSEKLSSDPPLVGDISLELSLK
jgi:hypothetical protein